MTTYEIYGVRWPAPDDRVILLASPQEVRCVVDSWWDDWPDCCEVSIYALPEDGEWCLAYNGARDNLMEYRAERLLP